MNAAEVLRAAGLDSEELRAVLYPVEAERVTVSRAPRAFHLVWRDGTAAMALGSRVLVRSDVLQGDSRALGRLLVHELVHVRQWAEYGIAGFLRRYLARYLDGRRRGMGHRAAYRANPYEKEAREVADRYGAVNR